MSPLLNTRAPVSVNLRLAAACAVAAALAVLVAFGGGSTGRPTAAVPAALAAGAVCAAVVAHLLHASARATADPRLLWLAAGVTLAFAGLLASLLGQPALFPDGGPVSDDPDASAARYLIWHAALLAAGALAVRRVAPTAPALGAFVAIGGAATLYAAIASAPFGDLATPFGGYHTGVRIAVAVLAAGLLATTVAWWRSGEGGPTWAEMCVIALLGLSAGDALAFLFASDPYQNAWWASLTLRAGQFAIPAVGLVIGFVAVSDRLHDLQAELAANLEAERERARRQDELASLDRRRRDAARDAIARLIDGRGLDYALQPIVDLGTRSVIGAEALARFTAPDGTAMPAEDTFLEAHALGLGVDLELAVIRRALESEGRLPEGMYLALNVSPALLAGPELEHVLLEARRGRSLVVELTEHQAVEDYGQLSAALERLRAHGVRVAVDDVGSGFASFRHVTRVKPEILKLDRSLVCGIDEDPVRQSLAGAIVAFAREVGATVVSEGIESVSELACLMDLAVGCGQGFYIARPAARVAVPAASVRTVIDG